jgi:small subunit ribosomal protein S6
VDFQTGVWRFRRHAASWVSSRTFNFHSRTPMPLNVYECMFMLDINKVAGDIAAAGKHLNTMVEKHQGEILASRPWAEQKLSYQIGSHKKGLYYLMYFRMEGTKLVELEHDLSITEVVIRNLVLKIDPKIEESMLAVARDEHALALQAVPDTGDDYGGGRDGDRGMDMGGRGGPRGGGRRRDDGDKD